MLATALTAHDEAATRLLRPSGLRSAGSTTFRWVQPDGSPLLRGRWRGPCRREEPGSRARGNIIGVSIRDLLLIEPR